MPNHGMIWYMASASGCLSGWYADHIALPGQNERRGGSRTYVIAGRDSRVVGYYTLAVGSVEHANAPAAVKKGLGQYPIPVIILARLATDKSIHGKGFGLALLKDALKRAYNVSREVGVRAVLVHAKEYVDLSCESSREIAARIGVVQWTIWDWLVGKRQPKAKSLMKLRRFLDAEAKRHFRATGLGRLNPYRTKSPGHFNKCATLGSARSAAKRGARSVR